MQAPAIAPSGDARPGAGGPDWPVYIVHARKLAERIPHIERQMADAALSFTLVTDYDADDIPAAIERRYFADGNTLTPGQKSCALKHVRAMEHIRDAGVARALILEDDVFLCPDFRARVDATIAEAERDWPRPHVLHLGAATNYYTDASKLRPGISIYAGDRVRFAEAYVLGAQEAALRLDWIARHRISLPIDLQYNVCDPALGIPFLWVEPPCAEQGSLTGVFRSSLDVKQRPQWRLRIQFPVQKLKRKYVYRWLRLR